MFPRGKKVLGVGYRWGKKCVCGGGGMRVTLLWENPVMCSVGRQQQSELHSESIDHDLLRSAFYIDEGKPHRAFFSFLFFHTRKKVTES